MDTDYGFTVAFEKAGPGKGEPVLPLLDQLVRFVDESFTLLLRSSNARISHSPWKG